MYRVYLLKSRVPSSFNVALVAVLQYYALVLSFYSNYLAYFSCEKGFYGKCNEYFLT